MARKRTTKALLPRVLYAQASPRSIGGRSLFDVPIVSAANVGDYVSEIALHQNAVTELQNAGFDVLQSGACTINIAGPPKLFESVFGTKLFIEERPVIKEGALEDTATFIDSTDTDTPGLINVAKSKLANVLEGVAIEEPYYAMQNAFAPNKAYWHLRVPGDVSLGINADKAHRTGITGKGIKVVMIDTGWFRHQFFVQRGYRSSPVVLGPGAANPNADENGHGTGESANIFSVAPDIDFTMVKMNFTNVTGAFNAAVALGPAIISNSWGSTVQNGPLRPAQQALAAAVATAVSQGIIVVFSAGNGHFGFPGQHPDVVSAGGTYMEADGSLEASSYSSGFASNIYPGRNVPDVSGLVGMSSPNGKSPGAMYIMLPVESNDRFDRKIAGNNHYRSPGATAPWGDETARNDGWAVFSGTSAAGPQLAGVCALIKQACNRLTPAQVRDVLKITARDVTAGNCSPSTGANPAAPGPDLATGHGLADAHRAVMVAKLRCRSIGPGLIVHQHGPIRQPGPIWNPRSIRVTSDQAKMVYGRQDNLNEEDQAILEQMIIDGEIDEV